jgi:predicted dehydrogenase
MSTRFAFIGFRHPHIFALYDAVQAHPDCQVVAACEEDAATRGTLMAEGKVAITHTSAAELLDQTDADTIAIGDVFAHRGALAIAALESGRHLFSDKPICTSLMELDRIEELASQKGLSVGCQLDLSESGVILRLREVIRSGELGDLCTVLVLGQHPLRLGSRAPWYFTPGCHGGTINDIGIHALDLMPWLTGKSWNRLLHAREWNSSKAHEFPHFTDSAQVYGLLENGTTFFGDFSYLAPDRAGYQLPQYWRLTVHGTRGMAEASYGAGTVHIATDDDPLLRELAPLPAQPSRCLTDFLAERAGQPSHDGLTTKRILAVSRLALNLQASASDEYHLH